MLRVLRSSDRRSVCTPVSLLSRASTLVTVARLTHENHSTRLLRTKTHCCWQAITALTSPQRALSSVSRTSNPHHPPSPPATSAAFSPWYFLADVHFDHSRLNRLQSTCAWFLDEVRRHQPSHVFLLGDTLHTRNDVHVEAASALAKFLQQLLDVDYGADKPRLHVHMLIGNHDMHHSHSRRVTSLDAFAVHTKPSIEGNPSINSSTPSIPLSSMSRLHVYRELELITVDGEKVLMVPYHHGADCRAVEAYINELAKTHDLSSIVCLAHLPLTGASMTGISISSTPGHAYTHASVSTALLAKFKRVFLGHFHIHQLVGSSGKILYVGAPQQFNYGDANDINKGFVSYDSLADRWSLYRNPTAMHYFSKGIEEWETQFAIDPNDAVACHDPKQKAQVLNPHQSSLYSGKCAEIKLPPDFDWSHGQRRLDRLQKHLIEVEHVEDIKVRQVKRKKKTTEKMAALEKEIQEREREMKVLDADATAAQEIRAILAEEARALNKGEDMTELEDDYDFDLQSNDASMVGDIVNGDLGPLIQSFVAADESLKDDVRENYTRIMQQLFRQVDQQLQANNAGGNSSLIQATTSSSMQRRVFRAQLDELVISNFLSVQGTLRFEFSALDSGVYYICGPNGAGKSLLLESLSWVLFGKTLRGHESDRSVTGRSQSGLAPDSVLNDRVRGRDKQPFVQVSLKFTNGFKVTRTHVHGQAGTNLRMELPGGVVVEPRSSRKLDEEFLQEYIGIGFERFASSALLSSTAKSFVNAKSEEKRRIIEELLGFTHFELLHKACKDKKDEQRQEKEQMHQLLQFETEKLAAAQQNQQEAKLKLEQRSQQVSILKPLLSKLSTEVSALRQQLSTLQAEDTQLATRKSEVQNSLTTLQAQFDSIRQGDSIRQQIDSIRTNRLQKDKQLSTLISQRRRELLQTKQVLEDRVFAQSKHQSEQLNKKLQQLVSQMNSLTRLAQLNDQLSMAKQRVQLHRQLMEEATANASKTVRPSSAQVITDVVAVLEDIVNVSKPPASVANRLRQNAIQPLKTVLSDEQTIPQGAESKPIVVKSNVKSKVNLQQQLDELLIRESEAEKRLSSVAEGADVEFELSQLPALQAQVQQLTAQSNDTSSASSSTSASSTKSSSSPSMHDALQSNEEWLRVSAELFELDEASSTKSFSNATMETLRCDIQQLSREEAMLHEKLNTQHQQESAILAERKKLDARQSELITAERDLRMKLNRVSSALQSNEVDYAKKQQEVKQCEILVKEQEDLLRQHETAALQLKESCNTCNSRLVTSETKLAVYSYWSDRLTDAGTKQATSFRSFCISRMLRLLNPLFEKNLSLFSQSSTGAMTHSLACTLTPQLELLPAPNAPSMEKRSEGQRKRTHLALFLTLFQLNQRRSQFQQRFLFLDEALDSLDEEGQQAVTRWIMHYATHQPNAAPVDPSLSTVPSKDGPLVFVITHSVYTSPSSSQGCLRVHMDRTYGSTYVLETSGERVSPENAASQHSSAFIQRLVDPEVHAFHSHSESNEPSSSASAPVIKKPTRTRRTTKAKGADN